MLTSMCNVQGSSAAEQALSPGRNRAQDKAKSVKRSSQPLRTEWSIAALTPRGPVSTTPRESGAQSMPAPGLLSFEATEAACNDVPAPPAGSSQPDEGASVAANPSLQLDGHSSHAACTPQGGDNLQWDPLPSSAAQNPGPQQTEHGEDSCGRGQLLPDQDVLNPQLPGSSPSKTQQPKAGSGQLHANQPLPQDAPEGNNCLRPGRLELEGNTEGARLEGGLPTSRQAPVHSPAQHGRHGSRSPSKKPTTSHFSIHVDSRAHVHRYSTIPHVRSDSAVADEPTVPQVRMHVLPA